MRPPNRAVLAGAAVGRWLHRIADAPLPPEVRMIQLLQSSIASDVTIAMVHLRVIDALAEAPLTVPALADKVGADENGLLRLLRPAEHLGLVKRKHDRYEATPFGDTLRRDRVGNQSAFAQYHGYDSSRRAWALLADAVRTDGPVFEQANGASVWQWFAAHPDEETTFATAMRRIVEFNGAELAALYPWEKGSTVCDVGGGIGTLLSYFLAREPTLRGVLLDQPAVLADAPAFLTERGVADRVELVPGDFFGSVPATADVFTLKDVLHDWDDERSTQILRTVRAAMRPSDRLVLVEIVQDLEQPHPLVPFVDLTMLAHTDGGRQRSLEQFDTLFAHTGLRRSRHFESPLHWLIEAAPIT